MIRRSTLVAVEILLGLIAALAIGVGIAWWRLSQGPIELSFFREQMESELSAARGGRPVDIERVVLGMSARGGALEMRAVGVNVRDAAGAVLTRADEARIELSVLPLLIGRVSLVRAEFAGGEITLTNKLDGALHVAFGPPGTPPDIIIKPPPPDETLRQRVARVLDGLAAAFRPVGAGGALRALSIRGAKLAIIDERGGGHWHADAANLELARQNRTLALSANARLEGAEGLAPASLRITTDTRFQTAVAEFGAEDVRPRALLSPAMLGPFAALDAPLTATISVGLDRQTGIKSFEGEAVIGRGAAEMPGGRFDLSGGRLHGRYDIESDELTFDQVQLAGARTRINGEVRIRDFSAIMRAAPNEPAAFDIALPSLTLDVPGTFSEPIAFSNVAIVGAIVTAERSIAFTRLSARTGEATVQAQGRVYWLPAGAEGKLFPGIELHGAVEGAVGARDVVRMWPMTLGEAGRDYVDRSLIGGRVTDGVFNLDVRPSDIAAGGLRNEAIDVRFNIENGEFRFVPTMSPITAARGSGVLRGNRLDITVPTARINNLVVTNGRVELPRLRPKGAMATISARAEGDARHLLELLMQEPLNLRDSLPIDPATATGRGVVNLRLQRPLQKVAPFELWRFTIDGSVRDLAGAMPAPRRVALTHGQLQVRGDQNAIVVSGPIRAGSSNIQEIRWTERLGGRGRSRSEYVVAGAFDADDLTRLGYPIARHAQGRIGVQVSGNGRGFDVNNARIDLDLSDAAVEAPRGFWTKRAGVPASARFTVERQRDGGLAFNGIDARGGGLLAQGRVRLSRDNRIIEVDLPRLAVEGRSDARLNAAQAADGGLDVVVRGALFDAAPFMSPESPPVEAGAAAPARAVSAPLRANVVVDRLKLRGGATLSDARVTLATTRGALGMLSAEGTSPDGRPFALGLGPRPGEPRGRIVFRSDDAGFAVRALTGAENVVGGAASAEGEWRAGQGRFEVSLRDFQVVRLPAMAQMLSSVGSLRGMVETLNGDGIGFSQLEAQMTYANDRVDFTEGAMRGPALGLTGSGGYDIRRDNLEIRGVVAPSPMLNLSMLGEVPVIGDLLVSRRGEGVFGMTYSINGRAGEPRVGVNPASALTPGILRRIFEAPPSARPPAPSGAGGGTENVAPEARAAAAEQPALP